MLITSWSPRSSQAVLTASLHSESVFPYRTRKLAILYQKIKLEGKGKHGFFFLRIGLKSITKQKTATYNVQKQKPKSIFLHIKLQHFRTNLYIRSSPITYMYDLDCLYFPFSFINSCYSISFVCLQVYTYLQFAKQGKAFNFKHMSEFSFISRNVDSFYNETV